jgi:hypothetical protein
VLKSSVAYLIPVTLRSHNDKSPVPTSISAGASNLDCKSQIFFSTEETKNNILRWVGRNVTIAVYDSYSIPSYHDFLAA